MCSESRPAGAAALSCSHGSWQGFIANGNMDKAASLVREEGIQHGSRATEVGGTGHTARIPGEDWDTVSAACGARALGKQP